jgi:fructose-bisphosphate aldolase, class II
VTAEEYRGAAALGVTKINVDTDSRLVWMRVYREYLRDHPEDLDFRHPGEIFMREYAALITAHSQVFGCAGMAAEAKTTHN